MQISKAAMKSFPYVWNENHKYLLHMLFSENEIKEDNYENLVIAS